MDCLRELIIVPEDDGDHESATTSLLSENSNNKHDLRNKEMKQLRIENAEQKRRIEQLEETNENLLLELASFKMDASSSAAASLQMEMSASSVASGFDGGLSDSSACVIVVAAAASNNNDQDEHNATIPLRQISNNMSLSAGLCDDQDEHNATIPLRQISNNMSLSAGLCDGDGSEEVSRSVGIDAMASNNNGGNHSNATVPLRQKSEEDSLLSGGIVAMASNNNEAQTTTTNAEEVISKGSNGGSDTPVTYEMSASSLLFDGNRSEGSECVIAANDSFSNNDDMGTSEHRMEDGDSNSNNDSNAIITVNNNMSLSSGLFDGGGTEEVSLSASGIVSAASNSYNEQVTTKEEYVISNGGGNNSNATIPLRLDMSSSSGFDMGVTEDSLSFFPSNNDTTTAADGGMSQNKMTFSSYIDYRYGNEEAIIPTTSNSSRRNTITSIAPRCSSHGARRATISAAAQHSATVVAAAATAAAAAAALSASYASMADSDSSVDLVTDYGYGDTYEAIVPTTTNVTGNGRRDMMVSPPSTTTYNNTSRRSLFRRKSETMSPSRGRRKSAAMSLNKSEHGSSRRDSAISSGSTCSSVDYEYGDTENSVPTSGYITTTATATATANTAINGRRRDMMASNSSGPANTSRRTLFRRKSGILASPRNSRRNSAAMSLSKSEHGSSRRDSAISIGSSSVEIDYEYGDTEPNVAVPTTTTGFITAATTATDRRQSTGFTTATDRRQNMMSSISRSKSGLASISRSKSGLASNRRVTICESTPITGAAHHRVTASATSIGRRKTICVGISPDQAAPSSTRSIPGRRISSASTDLLRIYNGFINLEDDDDDDDNDNDMKPPLILTNPLVQ